MARAELDLELDAAEEWGRRMEDEAVDARLQSRRELGDPAVVVGVTVRDELAVPVELDVDAWGRPPALRVEHVG
jgi:hypothetical protein